MSYPIRRFITESERQQIFDRWIKGESQYAIARALGRGHSSIQGVLSRTGGIQPRPRKRSRRALSLVLLPVVLRVRLLPSLVGQRRQ